MFRKNRFGHIVNLKHHGEMGADHISIYVVMSMTKLVDEPLVADRQFRIAQGEQAHAARV